MNNTINLRQYKVIKDCFLLFKGYKERIVNMSNNELVEELSRYKTEMSNYPNHLLTIVKGKLLMTEFINRDIQTDTFVKTEKNRIELVINKRLEEK